MCVIYQPMCYNRLIKLRFNLKNTVPNLRTLTEMRNLLLSKQRRSVYLAYLVIPVGNTDLVKILSRFTGRTTINAYPLTNTDCVVSKPLQIPISIFLKQYEQL